MTTQPYLQNNQKNSQAGIAGVVHPRIQCHSLFLTMKAMNGCKLMCGEDNIMKDIYKNEYNLE